MTGESARKGHDGVAKVPTGIEGFDTIAFGGLPVARMTLLAGTAGSGKTIFASQFLARGILEHDEPGIFLTFEESPEDIRANLQSFGWPVEEWEEQGKWAFVNASPDPLEEIVEIGEFDLGGLLTRVRYAIERLEARRLSIDAIGAVFSQYKDAAILRRELFRMAHLTRELGVSSVLTAERTEDYGDLSRNGVEEFLCDNVVILRNVLDEEARRRTIEILKFRGADHRKGEFPFVISAARGVAVMPLMGAELRQESTTRRIPSGNEVLDEMCGGGFFRDSVVLVSGATGTGKTLTVTHFLQAGVSSGQRCLLLGFEESRDQLYRNASGWGVDFRAMEEAGHLMIRSEYPEARGLEEHLLEIEQVIQEFRPERVAIDSLSALERAGTAKSFRQLVMGLTSFIKKKQITGMFTTTTPTLIGGTSVTEAHISSLTDSILLLRYVELLGEMHRGIVVLKMRGSSHQKGIRELVIDSDGMKIGERFRRASGILTGSPTYTGSELERYEELFPGD